jgi:hypothetical protein
MPTINSFKRWRNGEVFNARDYVYERDTIVNQVNRLSALIGDTGSSTNLTVATLNATDSITLGGETITSFEEAGTKVTLSTSQPTANDGSTGEVWIEYEE